MNRIFDDDAVFFAFTDLSIVFRPRDTLASDRQFTFESDFRMDCVRLSIFQMANKLHGLNYNCTLIHVIKLPTLFMFYVHAAFLSPVKALAH
jgi:hypothetical protein